MYPFSMRLAQSSRLSLMRSRISPYVMEQSDFGSLVVAHKTQVSPCGIKSDLKHHKSDSSVDPKRFCEVEQQARPNTGAGLAKTGSKSEFQSFSDPNLGLPGSNPVSTPNPDPQSNSYS